jgi:hypothetical protein
VRTSEPKRYRGSFYHASRKVPARRGISHVAVLPRNRRLYALNIASTRSELIRWSQAQPNDSLNAECSLALLQC